MKISRPIKSVILLSIVFLTFSTNLRTTIGQTYTPDRYNSETLSENSVDNRNIAAVFNEYTFDFNYDSTKDEVINACNELIVFDKKSNQVLYKKNENKEVFVNGPMVQLMTVLVALDYLSLEDSITVTEKQIESAPKQDGNLGLEERNNVTVEDLLASMLIRGATDAASVIVSEVEKQAAGESIASLMSKKALALGMNSSDYSKCDGIGIDRVKTTAIDQCLLYLNLIELKSFSQLVEDSVYNVKSHTETTNLNIADKIKTNVPILLESSKFFNPKVSSASFCEVNSEESIFAYFYHVKDSNNDKVFILWTNENSNSLRLKLLTQIAITFQNASLIDITQKVQDKLVNFSVSKDSLTLGNWIIPDAATIFVRYWQKSDSDQDILQGTFNTQDSTVNDVDLTADLSTIVSNDDGSYKLLVSLFVNKLELGSFMLETLPVDGKQNTDQNENAIQPTDKVNDSHENKIIPSPIIYAESDVTTTSASTMSSYGWIIIIICVAAFSVIILVIGRAIKNKMGQ